MTQKIKKIFIIAGEVSGDILAADLIKALKTHNPDVEIYGIGGKKSLDTGLKTSLFPMEDLSLMGIFEIVPQIPKMLKRIKQTVKEIERLRPDFVLSIDCPEFSFRVQKRVKKLRLDTKQVHYVAPTVWAWREVRAKKIARFLDSILCLFPFEPPYFEKVELNAVYTGHPVIKRYENAPTHDQAKEALGFEKSDEVIGLLLGSRHGELKRHGELFLTAIEKNISSQTKILVPTLPHLRGSVETLINANCIDPQKFMLVDKPENQTTYFKAMDKALAVSGTVGLELAVAGVPHIVGYRISKLTAFIMKRLIKTKYVHLANIILNKEIVSECIQDDCTAEILASRVMNIDIENQKNEFKRLNLALETEKTPSETVINFLKAT